MLSTPPEKLRLALLILGIVLGLSGVWMLLPVLLSPNPIGLSFDRNGAEAAAAHRTRAVLAAEIGAMRIRELRRRAEEKLGSRFDLPAFHATILEAGALPLDLLEQRVQRWIDATNALSR